MKIYLAGPDVFRPDVAEWADSARELCRRYGFEPLLPVDHQETQPDKIFQSNIDLIRKAQIVAANLDPFRGPEPDSGTAFELGYALALGKKVCGYVTHLETLLQRVESAENRSEPPAPYGNKLTDRSGLMIEDFGLPCNLMLSIPANIVGGGLEGCLKAIRSKHTVAS
jgi:nucleoside 2-deoxyribosyltransferase